MNALQRRRLAADPQAALEADVRPAYLTLAFFLAVNFVRPQDMFTPIGLLMPGALATLALAVVAVMKRKYINWNDRILRLYGLFMFICCLGVVNVVNHFFFLQAIESLVYSFIAYTLILPIAASTVPNRLKIMRWLAASHIVIALWAFQHSGQGQGAFLGDENDCALGLCVGTPFCFFLARCEKARFVRILWAVGFVVCLFGIVSTESRGGFLGLTAVLLGVAFFSRTLLKTTASLVVLVLLSLPFISPTYIADIVSINNQDDGTRVERIYSWGLAYKMYKVYPVLGIGASNYPWRVGEFEPPQSERPNPAARSLATRVAHSLYFTLLPETGTIGTLVFLAIVIVAVRRCWTTIRVLDKVPEPDKISLSWCQATAAGMGGFLVACTFVSTLYYPYFWLLISMTVIMPGLASAARSKLGETQDPPASAVRGRLGRRPSPARRPAALTSPRRET